MSAKSVKPTHIWHTRPLGPVVIAPDLSTFIGNIEPMNVTSYIHWCHTTNKHILYSSVPMNILSYVHQSIYQLTNKFIIYLSI
jgi:hypothetical protein